MGIGLGQIGGLGRVGMPTLSKGVGASNYAPNPAPSGYRWDYVTENGVRVTEKSEPVVALVRAA